MEKETRRKTDRLEKELEKSVILTMRNAYNNEGTFVVSSTECAFFSEALRALIEIRNIKKKERTF